MNKVLTVLAGVLIVNLIYFLIIAFPLMWMWNSLITEITSFKEITYTQSLGLLVIFKILTQQVEVTTK